MKKGPDNAHPEVAETLKHWQQDTDFAGVRGKEVLANLPEAERADWQRLWEEVP